MAIKTVRARNKNAGVNERSAQLYTSCLTGNTASGQKKLSIMQLEFEVRTP
jgi:hypothetical protein